MDQRHKKLIEDGDALFKNRQSLESLWQEIAYQFYPEMADFTVVRYTGKEFADHLTTSYPLIARRTLGDSLSAILRPVALNTVSPGIWFSMSTDREENEDNEAKRWLERATKIMRKAMYDRPANFLRATKEGDHSFVSFGNAPLSVELGRNRDSLLYRCWHLRDVAWVEDASGEICTVHRKWSPTISQLVETFGDKVSQVVRDKLKDDPQETVKCRHIMIKADKYEQRDASNMPFRTPWVSVWLDCDNETLLEEVGTFSRVYVIPRWVTVPGSQYAASPAVTAALPDARLIQAMSLTLLESGERFANPPMIATQEAIRSDIALFAGGVTYVDAEYDEKLGEALRPVYEARASEGMRAGLELANGVQSAIAKAFFLDSLSLPPAGVKEMTAFEVGQRISEWIRRAMPIFEPMEYEYNGALCEETFDILFRNGAFGPTSEIPQSLRGREIKFKFESPLHEGADKIKNQKFLEAKNALIQAIDLDPAAAATLNAADALRDVLESTVPPTWIRSKSEVEAAQAQHQQQQNMMQLAQGAQVGSDVAQKLGSATKDFAQANQ